MCRHKCFEIDAIRHGLISLIDDGRRERETTIVPFHGQTDRQWESWSTGRHCSWSIDFCGQFLLWLDHWHFSLCKRFLTHFTCAGPETCLIFFETKNSLFEIKHFDAKRFQNVVNDNHFLSSSFYLCGVMNKVGRLRTNSSSLVSFCCRKMQI